MEEKAKKPEFRYRLRGAFLSAGYRSVGEIAKATGFTASAIYSVTSGWRHPGAELQAAMAKALGISLRELREML